MKLDWTSGIGGAVIGVIGTLFITWVFSVYEEKKEVIRLKSEVVEALKRAEVAQAKVNAQITVMSLIKETLPNLEKTKEKLESIQYDTLQRAKEIDITADELKGFRSMIKTEAQQVVGVVRQLVADDLQKEFQSVRDIEKSVIDISSVLRMLIVLIGVNASHGHVTVPENLTDLVKTIGEKKKQLEQIEIKE